ncbi:MAG TPA: carbohydrate ABC transporter permease [Kosmotogaceae bacterium]|jgi:multiple sugar transport system permease protein|nr:MAG: ABC-type sugar transport system, permease component [Thermotogales bacterium 46_20]HAA86422.1 carbohydrate ABC transporter permease [Kosmotogaceae bacterium]
MKRSTKKKVKKTITYSLLVFLSVVIAFPFVWLILTAIKTYPDIYAYPIKYFIFEPTREHFDKIADMNFWAYFKNSVIVGTGTMFFSILIGLFPAYAFARYEFRYKRTLLAGVMVFQMLPLVVFLLPIFKTLNNFGILNTYTGLILSYLPFTTPISIMFMRTFFLSIPKSLEEAARIDGCTFGQAFRKVILPITLPGIAAVGVYAFLFSWSELMYSMSILTSKAKQTIPTFLQLFVGQYQTRWGPLFAGSILATIPPLIIFMILQKFFIAGLVSGSVKE